jgi:hypothetical protein
MMKFRPWGPLDWALSLSSPKQWHFLGVIGTEERSLCSWMELRRIGVSTSDTLAEIRDVDSEKYRDRNAKALQERRTVFGRAGGDLGHIHSFDLLDEQFKIDDFTQNAVSSKFSVVLDITSMPKRFYFLMLKALVSNPNVKNLLATYTSPGSYASDAPLYEDIEVWRVLPGFGGSSRKPDLWIVSVGFLLESFRKYVGDNSEEEQYKLLIPFPSPLSALRRSAQSVSELEQGQADKRFDKYRVDTLDMSAAFNRIKSFDGTPSKQFAFAPLGPKPTSAAMCLYALQRNSAVHYPQPTIYHPEYSKGVRNNNPSSAVCAYWIKHEGEFLYKI